MRNRDGSAPQDEDLSAQIDHGLLYARPIQRARGGIERIALPPGAFVDARSRKPLRHSALPVERELPPTGILERALLFGRARNPARAAQIPNSHERQNGRVEGAPRAAGPGFDLCQQVCGLPTQTHGLLRARPIQPIQRPATPPGREKALHALDLPEGLLARGERRRPIESLDAQLQDCSHRDDPALYDCRFPAGRPEGPEDETKTQSQQEGRVSETESQSKEVAGSGTGTRHEVSLAREPRDSGGVLSQDRVGLSGLLSPFRPGALHPRATLPADAPQLVAVGEEHESVALADLILQALDPGLAELDHPPAVVVNQEVVVVAGAHPLVPVAGLADPHAPHDAGLHREIQGAVDGRPGDLLALRPQPHEQFVGLEVLVPREELVEERLSFGRQLQAASLEVLAKNFPLSVVHAIASQDQMRYCPLPRGDVSRGERRREPAGMWQGFTI